MERSQFIEPLQSCAQIVPLPKAMKLPNAKATVVKDLENLRVPAWQLTKIRNKKEVIDEAKNDRKTVHFASSQEFGVGTKLSKIQRPNRTPR